jgi:hypothetical protein
VSGDPTSRADATRHRRCSRAIEIASLLAVDDAAESGARLTVALVVRLGAGGERIPVVDPLGRNCKDETFAYWVAGVLFALDQSRPRWSQGPAMAAILASKRKGGRAKSKSED